MSCGTACAGVFEPAPGEWGAKRLPVSMRAAAARMAPGASPLYGWG
jgi:pyruvate formate lyase activating enzyme